MTLNVESVADSVAILAAENVIESDLVEGRRRGVSRDVSAESVGTAIGIRYDDCGVPEDRIQDFSLGIKDAGLTGC